MNLKFTPSLRHHYVNLNVTFHAVKFRKGWDLSVLKRLLNIHNRFQNSPELLFNRKPFNDSLPTMPGHIRDFSALCGAKFETLLGKCTEKIKEINRKLAEPLENNYSLYD